MELPILVESLSNNIYFTSVGILFICLLVGLYSSKKSSNFRSPPGPIGLPLVGFLPFIGPCPHKTFTELKKKYGPLFRIQMGSQMWYVMGDYEIVKEAFVKQGQNFSARPHDLTFRVFDYEKAFVYQEGDDFKRMRMFSMDALKKLGFGRLSLEPLVKVEVQILIEELKKFNGSPVLINNLILKSVGNAVCSLLAGERSDYADPWLNQIVSLIPELQDTYVNDLTIFFPWITKVPLISKFTGKENQRSLKNKLWKLWDEKIDKVRKADKIANSFITAWFAEAELLKEKNDPLADLFSDFNLKNNLDILTQASFDTTSTTIIWMLYYLMKDPEIQKRIHKEIDGMMDTKEDLSLVDLKFMPYLKAFIQETHRIASIVSLGIFHCNMEETTLMGYHIPKRSTIVSNIYAVLHDEKDFPDPFAFKPERFISENGEYTHCEKVIAFSLGKRFCPGEYVVQMEIFNFLVQILHAFDLQFGPGESRHLEATKTAIARPGPLKVCFIPRRKN